MADSTDALTLEEGGVRAEVARQDAKWGEQVHPDGTGPDVVWAYTGPAAYVADSARSTVEQLAAEGHVTWRDIFLEEVAEAFAETDPYKLLDELTQVEAVARQWRLAIRRRRLAE